MLYIVLIKATNESEDGQRPTKQSMLEMNAYNDALMDAGIRVMAKGLHPSKEGIRKSFSNPTEVIEGPFSDAISGFFMIDVESKEEAIDWFNRVPDPMGHKQGIIELREIY